MPTREELINLGKYYVYLIIAGSFCFLTVKPLNPVNTAMENTIIESAKISLQSMIVDPMIKQVLLFILALYTTFVIMESLVLIRNCAQRIYLKNKGIV